jgi:hypothetical protein
MDDSSSCCIEEFIDGTMINMFYDQEWVVSTKTTIGATCRFYQSTPTFKELFYDTMKFCSITFNDFDPLLSYSFVMQHPLNRLVTPVNTPALYLVAAYAIDRNESTNAKILVHDVDVHELSLPKTVQFPKQFKTDSYERLTFPDWKFKGYMLKNNHVRSKIMNPEYLMVKELRSNQPKVKYHYLTIRTSPEKIANFLTYYPEFIEEFRVYELEIEIFTTNLYELYQECFIKKTGKLNTFPYKFKRHMYALHGTYLATRTNTTLVFVKKYVSLLHPSLLMHSLNCETNLD